METRILYLSNSQSQITKYRKYKFKVLSYDSKNKDEAIMLLESRFPTIIILNESIISSWGEYVLNYVVNCEYPIDLIIEQNVLTKGTLINLINNFSVSRVVGVNSRDFKRIVSGVIQKQEENVDYKKELYQIRRKLKQYTYILEQNMIES